MITHTCNQLKGKWYFNLKMFLLFYHSLITISSASHNMSTAHLNTFLFTFTYLKHTLLKFNVSLIIKYQNINYKP